MNYQEAIKIVNQKRIRNSGLKAGYTYRQKYTKELFRVLGFSLDTDTLDVMVIYSEVNDPIASNLFNTPINVFVTMVEIQGDANHEKGSL